MLIALGAASGAQAIIARQPWLSLLGFAVAIALIWSRGRDKLAARTRESAVEPPAIPAQVWLWFGAGLLSCSAAGVAVALRSAPFITHGLWFLGMGSLCLAATRANRGRTRPTRSWSDLALVGLLLLGCAVLYGWHLTTVPFDVHGDDTEIGLDALRLLEVTPFNLFRTGWFRLPIFHALPTALGLELFGHDLLGLRATSAIIGGATVLLTFALARRLWNVEVAIISAIVLATGRYFIHLSRAGYHYVDTPFISVAVLLLFLSAWRERRVGPAIWCGIVLGLGVQTYYASRLIAPLLLVTWLLWLWRSDPVNRRARFTLLLVTCIAAAATAAPMIGYYSDHWTDLWRRSIDTSLFSRGAMEHIAATYPEMSRADVLVHQLRAALLLFNLTPDTSLQYGYPRALLDPISAVFFVLGLAAVVTAITTRRAQLLVLWIVVPVIAGAALTIDAPFFPRISGVLPFAAITIALGLTQLLNGLRAVVLRVPDRAGANIGRDGTRNRSARLLSIGVSGLIAAAVLAGITANNLRSYFVEYAPVNRYGPTLDIARWIAENDGGHTFYMIGGAPRYSIRHGTIRFLNQGTVLRDIANLDTTLQDNPPDATTSRFVIMPSAVTSIRRLQDAIGPLRVVTHRNRDGIQFYTAIPKDQSDDLATYRAASIVATDTAKRTHGSVSQPPPLWAVLVLLVAGGAALGALIWLAATTFVTLPFSRSDRDLLPTPFYAAMAAANARTAAPPPQLITAMLLLLILCGAIALRLYRLDTLPAGFYCDEAGLGYNAWSILQTGRDETGARLPLFIWSFDTSYKNPIWIYSALLPVSLLGLTEFAVRVTSAAYGSATVLALFFLGRALLGTWGGLIAAAVMAVVPWHVHFSRIAFELITFPFFLVCAITCFVRSLQGRRLFPLAALLFGYSMYTYAIAKLFVPVFLAGCVLLFWRELWTRRNETMTAAAVLGLTVLPLFAFDLQNTERAGHYFADTSVFALPQAPLEIAQRIVVQYLSFFSPKFLFMSGDRVVRHAVQGHGELYYLFAPFLILGVIVAGRQRRRLHLLLLWWLLAYPLAPSLMTEAPTASRGIIGVPAFCLLIALGIDTFWRMLPRLTATARSSRAARLAFVTGGIVLTIAHVQHYWRLYSEEYPLYAAKYYTGFQYGHRDVIKYFQEHQDEYDLMVLTAHRSNQAHIFPLFYTHFPPRLFQEDHEGALRRTAKMQVGWLKEMDRFEQYDRLLFAVTDDELENLDDYDERARVIAPDGTPAFVLIDVYPWRRFVRSWAVTGPFPIDDDSPPPLSDPDEPLPDTQEGSGWRLVQSDEAEVDLNNLFEPDADDACAWAVNAVHIPVQRAVRVRAGFDDVGQVWVNGERVDLELQERPDAPLVDPLVGEAVLRSGRNIVAVRTCELKGDWFFYLNFTASNGQPVHDLDWEIDAEVGDHTHER